jgi:uncharacterized membrane protein
MSQANEVSVFRHDSPRVRRVGADRPWAWLAAGWNDLRRAAPISLTWGFLFSVIGLALLWLLHANRWYNFLFPLLAGFMLLAPILVVGLYKISQQLEAGNPVTGGTPFSAWTGNAGQLGLMGFLLGLFFLAWIRLGTLLFALFFGGRPPVNMSVGPPDLRQFVEQYILSVENLPFLIVSIVLGALLAFVVFSLSAVAVPMLMDRQTNVFEAVVTSAKAVQVNFTPMALWAVLIALFTIAGMAAGFIGLTVTLPLIAHGTWHAYRDLVAQDLPDTPDTPDTPSPSDSQGA